MNARWIRLGAMAPADFEAACEQLAQAQAPRARPIVAWAQAQDAYLFAIVAPRRVAPGRPTRWLSWGLAPAGRPGDAEGAEQRPRGLDHHAAADRGDAGAVADAALRLPGLGGGGELAGVGAEARRAVGLRRRHVGGMRTGEAVAQQNLRDAHAVDHRDGDLEAAIAALLQRRLRRLERGLGREQAHAKARLGGGRRRRGGERQGKEHRRKGWAAPVHGQIV